jgi:hypothetical protein
MTTVEQFTALVIRRRRKHDRVLVFSSFEASQAWLREHDWENRAWLAVETIAAELPGGEDLTLDDEDTHSVMQLLDAVRAVTSAGGGRLHRRHADLIEKLDQAAWFTSVRFHDRMALLCENENETDDPPATTES